MGRKRGQLEFPFARRALTQREIRAIVRSKMDAHGAFEVRHAARLRKRQALNQSRTRKRRLRAQRRAK